MTIIVQPITVPPPESASDVIAQHLQKLLGTLTFEHFAVFPTGEITIYNTTFYYRVGLFLAVPTEAIIAAGQFVKVHQIKEKAKWWVGLKVIDPERPEECLYDQFLHQPNINLASIPTKGWHPPSLNAGQSTQQSTVYAQNSLMLQSGIAGLGQLQAIPNPLANQKPQGLIQPLPPKPLNPSIWQTLFGTP
jgi:hypothetical protein